MLKVLVTRIVPGPAIERLRTHFHVEVCEQAGPVSRALLLEKVRGVHGILCHMADRMDREVFEAAGPQLKVISQYAVGIDNIVVPDATQRGIAVTNCPGVLSEATADIAWVLLMACARRVIEGDRIVRSGQFTGTGPTFLLGTELVGKTIGIVGAGKIGYAVARRAFAGWNMNVLYNSRRRKPEFESDFRARHVGIEELLCTSDVVSVHCPLTPETTHLLNEERLRMMKPTAILVNTARGPVIDESALVRLLQDKKIFAAGLDVYEREPLLAPGLASLDNVVLLPHVGSATVECREKMGEMCADSLEAVLLRGEQPPHAVTAVGR